MTLWRQCVNMQNTTGRGMLPRVVGRRDKEDFSVGVGWTVHPAGGFRLLDRNACPRGQGMLHAELPPRTLSVYKSLRMTKITYAMCKHVRRHRHDVACTYRSRDCEVHALLYRLWPGMLEIGCSALNSTEAGRTTDASWSYERTQNGKQSES